LFGSSQSAHPQRHQLDVYLGRQLVVVLGQAAVQAAVSPLQRRYCAGRWVLCRVTAAVWLNQRWQAVVLELGLPSHYLNLRLAAAHPAALWEAAGLLERWRSVVRQAGPSWLCHREGRAFGVLDR